MPGELIMLIVSICIEILDIRLPIYIIILNGLMSLLDLVFSAMALRYDLSSSEEFNENSDFRYTINNRI